MALNIKIDFENRYEPSLLDNDIRFSVFESILIDGTTVKLGIKISTEEHPYMPDVYNLAFGPLNDELQIDDQEKLTHQDHSKVFSTIVFAGLSFLTEHAGKYLGIDGSNTARAYMYYRCIQNNFDYLDSFFTIYGVNYYLRVLRDGSNDYDPEDLLAFPEAVVKGESISPKKLFNYFIFKLK